MWVSWPPGCKTCIRYGRAKSESARVTIEPKDVLIVHEADFPVPPEILWDYLSRAEYRALFIGVDSQEVHNRQDGRVGAGTVFECFHGNRKPTTQTVLEWRPFDLIVTLNTTPVPGTTIVSAMELTRMPDGSTVLVDTLSKAKGPLAARILLYGFKFILPKALEKGTAALLAQIEKDLADGTIVIPDSTSVPDSDIAEAAAEGLPSSS